MHGDLSRGWLSTTTKEIHLINKLDKNLLTEEDGRKNGGRRRELQEEEGRRGMKAVYKANYNHY